MKKLLSLLLFVYVFISSSPAQIVTASEIRFSGTTPGAPIAGRYRIGVNITTGKFYCIDPLGNDCAGGSSSGTFAITMPSPFTVSGSPADLGSAITVGLPNQNPNTIFAGPTSGAAAAATFRAMVAADIPNHDASKITSGFFGVAQGGLGYSTVVNHAVNVGNTGTGIYDRLVIPSCVATNARLNYSQSGRVFSCPTDTAVLGANTFAGLQTFNIGASPGNAIMLDIADIVGTGWVDSHSIAWRGKANDGATAYQPEWRFFNDVRDATGGSRFILRFRPTTADSFVDYMQFDRDGRVFYPPVATADGTCSAGAYWVQVNTATTKFRKCENGVLSDIGGGGGTVTSVGMTVPGVIFNSPVTGSPVTTAGSLDLSLKTQVQKTFFAGPTSGADATPTFRVIAAADVPTLNQSTTGNAATATALAANPANCGVDAFAIGIAADGTAECGSSIRPNGGRRIGLLLANAGGMGGMGDSFSAIGSTCANAVPPTATEPNMTNCATTATTVGTSFGMGGNVNYRTGKNISAQAGFKFREATQAREFFVITDTACSSFAGSDALASGNYVGVRFAPDGGDTAVKAVSNNGGASPTVSAAISGNFSTYAKWEILEDIANSRWLIIKDGATFATITATIPASGVNMRYCLGGQLTTAGTNRNLDIAHISIAMDN